MNVDQIYQNIIDRNNNNPTWFTDKGHKAVRHFAWYHGQYEQQYEEGQNKTHAFNRPAIFIEFDETNFEQTQSTGSSLRGKLPVIIHVVQDLYVDGREGAAQHGDFKALLQYWKLVYDLFQGWRGDSCAGPFVFRTWQPYKENTNMMVDRLLFDVDVVLKRSPGVPD
jgi:hypothetical protein